MRLIDADELVEIINYTFSKPPFSRKTIKHMIDMARTVDAVPARHGRWTPHEEMSDEWNCSETWYRCQCGYDTRRKTPYCPMCGARIEEDE